MLLVDRHDKVAAGCSLPGIIGIVVYALRWNNRVALRQVVDPIVLQAVETEELLV